jgi:hypothetical protein
MAVAQIRKSVSFKKKIDSLVSAKLVVTQQQLIECHKDHSGMEDVGN